MAILEEWRRDDVTTENKDKEEMLRLLCDAAGVGGEYITFPRVRPSGIIRG